MPDLILHKRAIRSVFQLLGDRENDITYSVAWALAKSDGFSKRLLAAILGTEPDTTDLIIRIQVHEQASGITDIEIESPGQYFVIIEAKKGWNAPTRLQLEKYAGRKSFRDGPHLLRRIVPLSECSANFVLRRLGCSEIDDVPVVPLTWQSVIDCASSATSSSHGERRLLQELLIYLRGVISMQSNDSNWVYVVSLGAGTPDGWSVSWIDIIQSHHAYFHVIGTTWPKEPPNYIAFRYGGKLQSIHHIEAAEVFTNPHSHFPGIPDLDWQPHFLYRLGPGFSPEHMVPTGNIYPSGRVWCMLDTLFTSGTIAEARDLSKKREHGT